VFYVEEEACVPVKSRCKPMKHFYVEKMTQEPCEGCCEHSWSSWEDSWSIRCTGFLEGSGKARGTMCK
jgi:hypothetical protein